jgi:hypothetical protein
MKYKIAALLVLTLFLGFLVDRLLIKYTTIPCDNNASNPADSICAENNNGDEVKDLDITYKTFSSPKADFTFEYPSDWVYDEEEISTMHDGKEIKTMSWGFYLNLEGDYRNRPPYLAVSSPTYEVVDFLSAGYKGDKFPYQLNVFLSNDPETCITYEQYEEGIGKYVYWQKGECFATFANITDIYKTNMIIFYSFGDEEKNTKQIGEHIVKSIKIK